MVLLQPSLVLIDHGHFQYNSVCLGLAMAAAAAVAGGKRRGGEAVFCRSRDACMHALPSLTLLLCFASYYRVDQEMRSAECRFRFKAYQSNNQRERERERER